MQRSYILCAVLSTAAALVSTLASAQTVNQNGLLRDKEGKTLYTFDKDAAGSSNCYDACATVWPPFMAKPGAQAKGDLTLHARKDGQMQWGMNGKPLYFYAADANVGDATGDGKGGVWHVIKPAASTGAAAATTSSYSATPYSSSY
jgi:predicted lipoprotein with Yx(FWY)xxD motif